MTTTTQTLGPLQRAWVDKLRHGGFSQTTGRLHIRGVGYCCLGVALEHVLGMQPVGEDKGICRYENDVGRVTNILPLESSIALGLRDGVGTFEKRDLPQEVADDICRRQGLNSASASTSLARMNDRGFTFAEIADLIETHPLAFFKEAR